MQPFGAKDAVVFWILTAYYTESLWLRLILETTYRVLVHRLTPFPHQSVVAQNMSLWEIVIVELLQKDVPLDGRVFWALFKLRWHLEYGDGLGASQVTRSHSGWWITSGPDHDLVVVFLCTAPEMYLEYLTIFLVNLQQQGFVSPAIYIPSDLQENLYVKLAGRVVLMANSGGCAKALAFLQNTKRRPDGVILNSPTFAAPSTPLDYVSESYLSSHHCTGDTHSDTIVTFGSHEACAEQTGAFVKSLRQTCRVKVYEKPHGIHNFGLVGFFGKRDVDRREAPLRDLARMVGHMLLWTHGDEFVAGGELTVDDGFV